MIELHRQGKEPEPFIINPDVIVSVEAHPDTVITLTTGAHVVVAECVDDVVQAVREWRVEILTGALKRRH